MRPVLVAGASALERDPWRQHGCRFAWTDPSAVPGSTDACDADQRALGILEMADHEAIW